MRYDEYLDSPVYWLRRAALAMHKAMDDELRGHELTGAQFEVLRHLWQQDELEQRALQERLSVTSPTLTGIVDGLAERGLVVRRQSPEDARVKLLMLTPRGKQLEVEMGQAVARVQQRLLAGFSPAEASLLGDWLRRVVSNVGLAGEGCD